MGHLLVPESAWILWKKGWKSFNENSKLELYQLFVEKWMWNTLEGSVGPKFIKSRLDEVKGYKIHYFFFMFELQGPNHRAGPNLVETGKKIESYQIDLKLIPATSLDAWRIPVKFQLNSSTHSGDIAYQVLNNSWHGLKLQVPISPEWVELLS